MLLANECNTAMTQSDISLLFGGYKLVSNLVLNPVISSVLILIFTSMTLGPTANQDTNCIFKF